jgi:hypothetical protein
MKNQLLSQRLLTFVLSIGFIALVTQYYLRAVNYSLFFNELAIDGAFQLFNPLRRMAAGQIPGHDFQFFHGIGLVYLHYLPFSLLGKNLAASELSRFFLSPLLFLVANLLFFLAVKFKKHIALILTFATSFIFYYLLGFQSIYYPGNSLLGVRSAIPLISFSFLFFLYRTPSLYQKTKKFFLFETLAGTLTALCFFFSIEHGISSFIGMSVVLLFFPIESKKFLSRIFSYVIFLMWYLIFLFGIHGLATYGHVVECLKYELIDVPSDQFWYFGGPPNPFLGGLSKIYNFKAVIIKILFGVGVLLPIFWKRYLQVKNKYKGAESLLLFLLCYGIFSCIGYLGIAADTYTLPLARIELFLVLFLLFTLYQRFKYVLFWLKPYKKYVHWAEWLVAAIFLIVIGIRFWKIKYEYQLEVNSGNYAHEKTSGVYLNSEWWGVMKIAEQAIGKPGTIKNGQLWSTYSGLLEAEYGVFNPDTDYVIHALGKERREQYLEKFISTKPEYVTTIQNDYFQYEEWLQDTSWAFYSRLIQFYEPIARSNHRIIWKKKTNDFTFHPSWKYEATIQKSSVYELRVPQEIRDQKYPAIEVHVKYELHNSWKKIPFVGKLPRFILFPVNAVSTEGIVLPPYQNEWTFPIFLKNGEDPSLKLEVLPRFPGTQLEIKKIEYSPITVSPKNIWALLAKQK